MYRFSGNRLLTTQIQNYKVITAIASGLSCPGWLDSGIKMKEQNYKLLTNGVTCQDRSFYIWNLLSKTETKHYCVYGMKNGTTFTCGWTNIGKWNPPGRSQKCIYSHFSTACHTERILPLWFAILHRSWESILPQDNNCNVMKSGLNMLLQNKFTADIQFK